MTQQLALSEEQVDAISVGGAAEPLLDEETLLSLPLFEAKRLVAADFERRYLVRVMERAGGSVSRGASLTKIDRTNFRRMLHRHGLRAKEA